MTGTPPLETEPPDPTGGPTGGPGDPVGAPAIVFSGVTKQYRDGTTAVAALDLEVREHELLCLVGPSGCGKSTILRMVNRLVEPTSGTIRLDGEDIARRDPVALRRGIGYVIQHVGLLPHRTVAQNVATVPRLLGWRRERTRERVAQLLDLVGLPVDTYGRRYPSQLSGGERQRVGVARALAVDPTVLLMDEPFGAVDPLGRRALQEQFRALQRRIGTTVMFVTHDIDEAVLLADRIAVFSRGGRVEQVGTPAEVLATPGTPFVRSFVGEGRAVRLMSVVGLDGAGLLPPDAASSGPVGPGPESPGNGRPSGNGESPGVGPGATLEELFVALAGAADGRVRVLDGEGAVVGVATPEVLHAALRSAIAGQVGGDDAVAGPVGADDETD